MAQHTCSSVGIELAALVAVAASIATAPSVTAAPALVEIVHSFNVTDGRAPSNEPLSRGPFGTVFGVTQLGGATDEGTLYFVDPFDGFHHLHSFSAGRRGGWMPTAVFFSPRGELFGTTAFGGAYECGTAFRVGWNGKPHTIRSFNCVNGYQPSGRVVERDGFFYGTTGVGGNAAAGTVYRLSPNGHVTVIHDVAQRFSNEAGMYWGLGRGLGNELVGATYGYDIGDFHGVVFRIDGSGNTSILHTFTGGSDGSRPTSSPVVTTDGTVYGTTSVGGVNGSGILYKITAHGEYSVAHTFGDAAGPLRPTGGLMLGQNGKLYGTSSGGGESNTGTVYEYTTSGELTVVYSFPFDSRFGSPQGGLVETASGTFYGTTGTGGDFDFGTIYKLTLQ